MPEKLGLEAIFDIAGFSKGISDYTSKLDAAAQHTEQSEGIFGKLGNALGGAVKIGAAAAIGGVTALAGGIISAASAAGEWGNKLDSIGDILGTTAGESAGLAVAVERVGGNAEAFANQLVFMGKNLEGANGKLGKSGEAIKALGVSAYDANGNLRSTSSIAQDVATKVALMPDGLEKSEVMMNIFGRSGKDLSDVMTGLANGGLDAATQQAKEYGLAMSDDAVSASIESGKQMKQLEQAVQGLVVGLGTQLLPIILPIAKQLMGMAMSALPAVRDALDQVMKFVTPLINGILNLIKAFQVGAEGTGGFVGGLSNLLYSLDTVSPVFDTLGDIVVGLGDVFKQLFLDISQGNSIVGIISQAISGLGTVFGLTEDDAYTLGDTVFNALTPLIQLVTDVSATFGEMFRVIGLGQDPIRVIQGLVAQLGMDFGLTEDSAGDLATVVTTAFTSIGQIIETEINAGATILASLEPVLTSLEGIVDGVVATVSKSLPKMTGIFEEASGIIQDVINTISKVITAVFGEIAKFLEANGDDISGFIDSTWNTILDIIDLALKLINATIVPALKNIARFIQDNSDNIQSIFRGAWEVIKGIISVALDIIKGVIKTVLALVNGDTQGALDALKETFSRVWEDIKGIVDGAIHVVQGVLGSVMNSIKTSLDTTWSGIRDSIVNTVGNIKSSVSNSFEELKGNLNNTVENTKNDVSGKWNTLKDNIGGTVENIKRGVGDGFENVKNSVVNSIQNAINGIGDLLGRFYDKGKEIVQHIVDGINNIADSIRNTITGIINGAVGGAIETIKSAIAGIQQTISDIFGAIQRAKDLLRSIGIGSGSSAGSNYSGASNTGASFSGAGSVYNTSYTRQYAMTVNTSLPINDIQQQFAIMEALAS